MFDDGTGYNLEKVVAADNFVEAVATKDLKFFFHPCGNSKTIPDTNIQDKDNMCKKEGYILCRYDTANHTTQVIGSESNMEFRMNGETMEIVFKTQKSDDYNSVSLQCVPKLKLSSVLYAPPDLKDGIVSNLFLPGYNIS